MAFLSIFNHLSLLTSPLLVPRSLWSVKSGNVSSQNLPKMAFRRLKFSTTRDRISAMMVAFLASW